MKFKIFKNKLEQFTRLIYVNSITKLNGSILLVEFPKSGGTWLGQLISNYLKIPFPRNQFPTIKKSMYHSHYLPKYSIHKNKKIIYLVRDGRDVIISLYYHQLLWNDKNKLTPKNVNYHRSKVPFDNYEDVKSNMSEFIKYTFEHTPSKLQHFTHMGNWYEYNTLWLNEMKVNKNIYLVKYEDLLEKPYSTLETMFKEFFGDKNINKDELQKVIDKFSFENQTKRKKGEENASSFLRKGIKGDWKNYFGEEEKLLFKKYTKNLLVELDYEKNINW
ncbi:sulfotransferase domain-containing protein [Urechidicola croceus]|uniref:Sulfotransferase domain-containing protein n=1 Tax=Urechidicola croceus TaxID=1850246 RepID=A0A1D8P9C1_9FLAO|nr:sulfotransferase domain-containing protein [Urechidicola croceus]AOW21166.1 hypothetical protein LPB138_10965 [Urechidicola croceus]